MLGTWARIHQAWLIGDQSDSFRSIDRAPLSGHDKCHALFPRECREISYEAQISLKRHEDQGTQGRSVGMSTQLCARGVWGLAVAVACSGAAIAQQTQRDPQQPQQQSQIRTFEGAQGNRGAAGAGRIDLDHYLVKVLIKANKDEIEMGKLAEQRASNADVKQLASQMIQDHTRFLNQLASIKGTGNPGANPQAGSPQQTQGGAAFRGTTPNGQAQQAQTQQAQNQQAQNQQAQNQQHVQQQVQPGVVGQPGIAGQQDHREHMAGMGEHGSAGRFAKIMEEVDRNTQQSMVRELSAKAGAQFDRCYLSGQLFGHMWVVEALKTFEQDASPQLRPILQEGLQASEQHLTHIKSVLAKVESEPRPSAGRTRGRFNR
jgi:predicted outer membrane protein